MVPDLLGKPQDDIGDVYHLRQVVPIPNEVALLRSSGAHKVLVPTCLCVPHGGCSLLMFAVETVPVLVGCRRNTAELQEGHLKRLPGDKEPVPGVRTVATKGFVWLAVGALHKRLVVPVLEQVSLIAVGSTPVGVSVGVGVVCCKLVQDPHKELCFVHAAKRVRLHPHEVVDEEVSPPLEGGRIVFGVILGVLFPRSRSVFIIVGSTKGDRGFRMRACVKLEEELEPSEPDPVVHILLDAGPQHKYKGGVTVLQHGERHDHNYVGGQDGVGDGYGGAGCLHIGQSAAINQGDTSATLLVDPVTALCRAVSQAPS